MSRNASIANDTGSFIVTIFLEGFSGFRVSSLASRMHAIQHPRMPPTRIMSAVLNGVATRFATSPARETDQTNARQRPSRKCSLPPSNHLRVSFRLLLADYEKGVN